MSGASVNYPNGLTGSTPLHEAVESSQTAEFNTFFAMFCALRGLSSGEESPYSLFDHKASSPFVACLDSETVTSGDTPLSRALLLKRHRIAALLIRHGCDVNHGGVYSSWGAPTGDHLSIAKARGLVNLVRLLVKAGFHLNNVKWLPKFQSNQSTSNQDGAQDHDAITLWLMEAKHNPQPLVDICRLVIRRRLRDRVAFSIANSGLPKPLKMFLMLEDIGDDGSREDFEVMESIFM
ncbi:hypothetical protein J437_LFUL012606 [Ladona fulva]|uniref:Ankyrin n=1 Tax=Ladona fulva TaxID=123851 RepID=A0A8K0KEP0_LADFU|nr:hypothetical protein J437_LFUL012606 [Ladona fulva]